MLIVPLYTTKCLASYTCTNLRYHFSSSFQIISYLFLKLQKSLKSLKIRVGFLSGDPIPRKNPDHGHKKILGISPN